MLALAAQVPPPILHSLIRFDDTNIIPKDGYGPETAICWS